jgi:LuxR family transcriptional regulator, quorum-sensing system regulator BjaR1
LVAQAEREIYAAVSAMWAAPDPKGCVRIFRKVLSAYQINTFASGEIDLADTERTVFYAIGWPDAFRKFYLRSGLLKRDPIVEALKRRRTPFTWSDLRRDRTLGTLGSEALAVCAENGWTEGLAVPIPRGGRRLGLITVACQRRDFRPEEKAQLTTLMLGCHERLRSLAPAHGFAVPPLGLTAREIACLQLVAHGASDREIGQKLGISQNTAHEHCETAKKKLKVSTRAEAIAIAVSLAIVAP